MQAGFLLYPGSTLVSSGPMAPTPGSGDYMRAIAAYDREAGRWLPVGSEAIAPDGISFAYADYDLPPSPQAGMAGESRPRAAGALATTGRIHLVDARTGADRILFDGSPTFRVVGFTADGIYLSQVLLTMDGEFASGLFLLSPGGGQPTAVPGGTRPLDRSGWAVLDGAAWGVDFSTGGGIQPGNELVRLDLKSGAVQVWMTQPEGTAVVLVGFDAAGTPLVLSLPSGYSSSGSPPPQVPTELWAVGAAGARHLLYRTPDNSAPFPSAPSYTDTRGAWLSGLDGGVWLAGADTLLTVTVPVSEWIGVGGTCV